MIFSQYIANIVMFPGVIVHQMIRILICRMLRIAVFDACFYRFANPPGYVLHEEPKEAWHRVMLILGPMKVGSLLGIVIGFPAAFPDFVLWAGAPLDFFLIWLGVSIAAQSFPSKEEALWLAANLNSPELSAGWKIVAVPTLVVASVGVFGRVISLDVLYGVGMTLIGPLVVMWLTR